MIWFLKILAVTVFVLVVLPVATYLVVKFGVAAYYAERKKNNLCQKK